MISSIKNSDPVLAELIYFSSKVAASRPPRRGLPVFADKSRQHREDNTAISFDTGGGSYATPLTSLRERDAKALEAFFEREDRDEIAADVIHYLLWLFPTPCWEDDPLELLELEF